MDQDQIKQQTEEVLKDIQQKREEIQRELDTLVQTREDLRNKVAGIRGFHTNAENKEKDIGQLLTGALQSKRVLDDAQLGVEKLKNEIETYYQQFLELKNKLDNPENGLSVSLEGIQQKREESVKKYEEIVRLEADIGKLKTQAEEERKEIDKFKAEAATLKTEIEKWLELVSDSARFNEFSKRKKELQKESYIWVMVIIGGFMLLAYFVHIIFIKNLVPNHIDLVSSINKFFYTTPVLLLLLWATRHYAETRLYLEKYAYRAILSVSLSSYLELLESKFGEDNDKLEKLAFDSIDKIFKEPYVDKEKKYILNLLGGKIIYEDSEKILQADTKSKEEKEGVTQNP